MKLKAKWIKFVHQRPGLVCTKTDHKSMGGVFSSCKEIQHSDNMFFLRDLFMSWLIAATECKWMLCVSVCFAASHSVFAAGEVVCIDCVSKRVFESVCSGQLSFLIYRSAHGQRSTGRAGEIKKEINDRWTESSRAGQRNDMKTGQLSMREGKHYRKATKSDLRQVCILVMAATCIYEFCQLLNDFL